MSMVPVCLVRIVRAPYGSATTAMSVRAPCSIAWRVPIPLLSSAATQATTTSPRSGTPARRSASVAMMQAVRPAFML